MSDSAPGQPAFPLRIIIAAPIEEYPEEIRGSADLIIRAGRVLKNRNGVVNTRASDEQILSCEVLELATARGLVGRLHPEPVAGATGKAPADQSGIPGAALTDDPRDRGLSTGPGEGPAEPTPAEVRLLTDSIRSLSRPTEAFLRFPDGTVERIRPVLKDWMGGTPQKPWPDFEWVKPHTRPNPHLDPAYVEKVMDDLAAGAGWKGTPPAAGTRRATIFEALKKHPEGAIPLFPPEVALRLADEVESALLSATIDEEAMARADISAGIKNVECTETGPTHGELAAEARAADDRHAVALIRAERAEEKLRVVESERTEFADAVEGIGEALARLDAPEGPTFAKRIERLYRQLREDRDNLATVTDVKRRLGRALEIDVDRVHNLLDGWEIRRETDDGGTRSLFERAREFAERLRRTEEDLDTEQHRVSRPAGTVPRGTSELHVVVAQDASVDYHRTWFIELEDQDGASIGGLERRQGDPGTERIVIPYGRDDEWVQAIAMAAIVAGQEADKPFPADALDAVLLQFEITPTLPREWPHREGAVKSMPAFEKALKEIPVHFDDAQRQMAKRVFEDHGEAEEEEAAPAPDPDREDKLLDQREEARAGESRFAEERNAAYALIRWLLPVYVPHHVSTGIDDEED